MPLHHHLPACHVASFSRDTTTPRRERRIWAGDLKDKKVFPTSVRNVAAVNNLYTMKRDGVDNQELENSWSEFEGSLTGAIDALVEVDRRPVSARVWARVLVPFVTGLFVRDPDFGKRLDARLKRFPEISANVDPDNANHIRQVEFQFMLAPVLAARWLVNEVEGAAPLVTNDLGYCFENLRRGRNALTVPLNERAVLRIVPERSRRIVTAERLEWWADIQSARPVNASTEDINRATTGGASRYIYGPTEEIVRQLVDADKRGDREPIDARRELGFSYRLCAVHHLVWFHLVSALALTGGDARASKCFDEYDLGAITSDWHPKGIVRTSNIPTYRPGLELRGNEIHLDLFEVPGYTDQAHDSIWSGQTFYPGDPLPDWLE